VHWLGFDWHAPEPAAREATTSHLYFASDYFDFMYRAAEALVDAGQAYVDEQSADEMRASRGDFATPAATARSATHAGENLARLRQMKDGELADGAATLRAKIDMASPNINLRDPALYRIKRATHHNTGDRWCIYPMYTYAHPIEDALENITHSICTLEFEDQRPFYDWLLDTLCALGLLAQPRPHQYEFARLNVSYVITSKRKLRQLVDEKIVDGWDDPRMPTIAGLRRRGYTPESIRLLCERAGTSKAGGWTDYASLEIALRDDLDPKAPRAMAVLDPVRLTLTNWSETFGDAAHREPCHAPVHPQHAELGTRDLRLGPELWIERDDFAEVPAKGFFRLYPATAFASSTATSSSAPAARRTATARHPRARDDRRRHQERHAGRRCGQGQGHADLARRRRRAGRRVRLYDRLFVDAHPDTGGKDFKASLNPASKQVVSGSSSARSARPAPAIASSSSGTATSSPTSSTTDRAGRSSTAPRHCATPGRADARPRAHIGGWKPLRPAVMRSAVGVPSRLCALTMTRAPGTSNERSPGCRVTTGIPSGTRIVFSPSL
jgi:glutaminyl-tRNA synthetase